MLKKIVKWILFIAILGFVYFRFYARGNNRFTVYHHHGLWLPSSTRNIKFTRYPDFPNLVDDWATTECEMSKEDYFSLLKKQEYRYLIRIDTSQDKQSEQYIYSQYAKIPDSLIFKIPSEFGCKSNSGDALGISAEEINKDMVKVKISTDWN